MGGLVFSENKIDGLAEAVTPALGGFCRWPNTVKLGVVAAGSVSVPNWLFW
jgi:hypothetical protein